MKRTLAFGCVEKGREAVRNKNCGEAEKFAQKALDDATSHRTLELFAGSL